ncbi:hypothetical protein [Anaeromyxobacter diazotrophicus]|uniref:EfeO-type cupredoxin-like domain-containing protein n=1 Tax=Anaeromyxobacter diazotrophicus TaxID=2590199 RepID=A0A7I9VPP0_9BACT|nr:hypothetical protein [Anaeromyxobacter diazotrophicus]GEJ58109.1 hypothetical protein AMYX_28500 [Anaeromyxobacter diazotrophicus]
MLARLHLPRSIPAALAAAIAACGAGATADLNPVATPYVVTVRNYQFLPADLAAPPGATVLFRNDDDYDHWLMSAAAPGQYVEAPVGGVALDLYLPARSEQPFQLPATAAVGTVVPYFCWLVRNAMMDQGTITIAPPAAAASAPPGTAPAR